MVDVVDRKTRSRMMASIGPANTAPEVAVRRYLHAAGLRFRLHDKRLPGRPDIVLPGPRIAIFVHGCFWHRHPGCRYTTTPATRGAFWRDKFASNIERDKAKADMLDTLGWTVLVVWECETRDMDRLDSLYWIVRAQSGGGHGR
jgi:DNA mismatch endonuclease (patch repair protein)